ncbi:MbnP family protein [Aridibaculum aurantiacum]|uniref:MbnP family protein n=1 Tax=Aridibaculum aurantiacum TaxID=2810307 RepID=UPI001A95BE66|nr:MbnP family protein [Aridibaculum aurantiacum]
MKQILYLLLFVVMLWSCKPSVTSPEDTYQLKVTFRHKVGSQDMQLGNTYQNSFGENYTLSAFKYYVSNIVLPEGAGSTAAVNEYRLVDEANASTKSFTINLPRNHFSGFSFLLGVDSVRNVSGTQSGDLDPVKGMFWTWNSGYVMAKLEGTSPVSPAPANSLSLHIGGFRTGENATRRIDLALPAGSMIHLSKNKVSEIVIEADASTWFQGVHDLPIASNPLCHSPGTLAVKFADNYSRMFKIVAVNN